MSEQTNSAVSANAERVDYREIMEEIREIYIDPDELDIRIEEDRDEDGVHLWKEVESSKKQDLQVIKVLADFHLKIIDIIHAKIIKKLHEE